MAPDVELVQRVTRLRAEVSTHKRTLRRTKDALHTTAAALAALETECRRRGIAVTLVTPQPGEEGDSSWPHRLPHS